MNPQKMKEQKSALILIVDDIPENLRLLGNIFREEHIEVAIAGDGRRAIEIAKSRMPDVVLLDIQMPGMDGFEVCRTMKTIPGVQDIPVLFLTARTHEEDVLNGFDAGGADYITKPFNRSELVARVRTSIELHRSRKQIIAHAEELQRAIATKDKFFNIIAHDLKSPFTALFGLAEIINEQAIELGQEELKRISGQLLDAATNTFKLIQNLLEWARFQTGRVEYMPAKYDIAAIFHSAISVLLPAAETKGIRVAHSAPEGLMVHADRQMIETVIRNLVSNAIKFSNRGAAIKVTAVRMEDEALISVKDEGVGIPQDAIPLLFDLSAKYSTDGTEKEKGTGLGLALCSEILSLHGKLLSVHSDLGKGTTVSFTLSVA